jgi:Ion channel
MLYRFAGAVTRAAREESFVAIVGAAVALELTGTVVYTLGEGWSVVDGFYFSVCTLTTSSIADPDLVLTHDVAIVIHSAPAGEYPVPRISRPRRCEELRDSRQFAVGRETRTRTGDTTTFSRVELLLGQVALQGFLPVSGSLVASTFSRTLQSFAV